MTVSTNSRRREYQGNGVTQVFNGPMAYTQGHVLAYTLAGGVLTLLPSSSYDVEKLGAENGTRVTMHTPPASGVKLILLRTMPYSQDVDITNQGAFHAETIEKGFDALAMQIQQLNDNTMQLVFDQTSGQFVWDAEGNRIVRVGDPEQEADAVNLRSMLLFFEQVQAGGGASVTPKYWEFTGNAEDDLWELEGADVSDPLFYDVVLEGLTLEPYDQFVIETGTNGVRSVRLIDVPASGAEGFVILRGLARPASSDLRRIPMIPVPEAELIANRASEFALLLCTNVAGCEVTIPASNGNQLDFLTGSYFSVVQQASQPVSFVAGGGVTLKVAAGFTATTRAIDSVITASCLSATANVWQVTGDLAEAV